MPRSETGITGASGKSSGLTGYVHEILRWCELFLCLGIHSYWVLGKSWPLAAESATGGFVLFGGPYAIALITALLIRIPSVRRQFVQLEAVLHLSAALCFFLLLVYLTLRDPFHPWLPYSVPIYLWSTGIAFILVAHCATRLRCYTRQQWNIGLRHIFAGLLAYGSVVALIAGMTWPAYFWTAIIVSHAILAIEASKRRGAEEDSVAVPPLMSRLSPMLEAFTLVAVLLLAQLRQLFTCSQIGTMEVKYVEAMHQFTSPLFFCGVAAFLLFARFRLAPLFHVLLVLLATLSPTETAWPTPVLMGYGLIALVAISKRLEAFSYMLLVTLMVTVLFLGQFVFNLSGLIINYGIALPFLNGLLTTTRIFTPVLLILYLLLFWQQARSKRIEPRVLTLPPARWPSPLVYCLLLTLMLVPVLVVMVGYQWYLRPVVRAPQVTVEDSFGTAHAGYTKSAEEYERLNALGVRVMRVDFHWRTIQPNSTTWDFSRFESYLDVAEQYNKDVIALLVFDNKTVETVERGKNRDKYIAPEDVPLFLEYVRRTVDHFQDRVYAWEIWNEPDIDRFWQGTDEEFYPLARQTADVVREVDPDARIIGTAMTGPLGIWTTPMVEGMHRSGALDRVDHPACHLYIPDPRGYINEYSKIKAIAAKYNHPGAPWMTETGDPDGGSYPWRASSALLAEHVIKSHTVATSFGYDMLIWYCLRDADATSKIQNPKDSEGFFGLVEKDGTWKPAAYAYHLFTRYCSNSSIRSDRVQLRGGVAARQLRSAFYQRENGESALILWLEPMLRPAAQVRVELDLGAPEGTPVLHDIGSAYKKDFLDPVVDVSEKPVFITFTQKDTESGIDLRIIGSPVDTLWLLLLAGLLGLAGYILKTDSAQSFH